MRELSPALHRCFRNAVQSVGTEEEEEASAVLQRGRVHMASKLLIGAVMAGGLAAGFSLAAAASGSHAPVHRPAAAEVRHLYDTEVALNGQERHLQALLEFSEAELAAKPASAAPTAAAPGPPWPPPPPVPRRVPRLQRRRPQRRRQPPRPRRRANQRPRRRAHDDDHSGAPPPRHRRRGATGAGTAATSEDSGPVTDAGGQTASSPPPGHGSHRRRDRGHDRHDGPRPGVVRRHGTGEPRRPDGGRHCGGPGDRT